MRRVTQHHHLVRTTAALAATATALVLPWSVSSTAAHAEPMRSEASQAQAALPPGVVRLEDGENCPSATLCLYRDTGRRGPAYGIGAGYDVDLKELPITGGVGGSTSAANNVSSWVNNTASIAQLIDVDTEPPTARTLGAGQPLEESATTNDTVDKVRWNPPS